MLIALAQIAAVDRDVVANVQQHVRAVSAAAATGARLVLFPELSLTGYVPADIAADPSLTLAVDDARLLPLREECQRQSVTAVVGAPTRRCGRNYLSALLISAQGDVSVYDKRNLFEQEQEVFSPGQTAHVVELDGRRLALGICADLGDAAQAAEAGAVDAWLLGVLLSASGYQADAERAAITAQRHQVAVVLTNHPAATGAWRGVGLSGLWRSEGEPSKADSRAGVWLVDLDDASVLARIA